MNTLIHYILPPLVAVIIYLSYLVGMDSATPFFLERLRDTRRRKRTDAALRRDNLSKIQEPIN